VSDLWGGRFQEELSDTLRRFSSSLSVDRRLVMHDLTGTKAHAGALRDAGVLSEDEYDGILSGLAQIASEVRTESFPPAIEDSAPIPEDIHSAVEARLVELCGEAGYKIHAGRSRNDQVVTDVLLWLKEAVFDVERAVREVQRTLIAKAQQYRDQVIPAYTHLQRAQSVLLAHHLHAHFEALERDLGRLRDAGRRADRCPLGAGACAGSSLPLDREVTADRLGFARVSANSIDAVADRDWAIEFVSACALIMTHLSRLAEELILWSSGEFGMVRLADSWTTGSSALPHKRNPDVAELVRGKAAAVLGDLVTLHGLLKGLPLAYNRDLQEDKAPLFRAADATSDSARVLAAAIATAEFTPPRSAGPDFSTTLDLAEELVRQGMPFRTAHQAIGRLVRRLEEDGRGLAEATDGELAELGAAGLDRRLLTAKGSIESKRTLGSTSPSEVARELEEARAVLEGTPGRESGTQATLHPQSQGTS
jgi:argininosuccinate lyase